MSVGTFLVCYESVDVKPGSPVLKLNLVIDVVNKTASGTSYVTQATNPPLDVVLPVTGKVITMTVMPNITHYQLQLASPQMPGRHINILGVVDGEWNAGTADVDLWTDTPQGTVKFETAIAKVPGQAK